MFEALFLAELPFEGHQLGLELAVILQELPLSQLHGVEVDRSGLDGGQLLSKLVQE